jgi:hypothetical protein
VVVVVVVEVVVTGAVDGAAVVGAGDVEGASASTTSLGDVR